MCIPADAMRLEILLSLVIPTTVASIRGSRSENWSAAVAKSIPAVVQTASIAAIVARSSGLAGLYEYRVDSRGRARIPPP
jgi:hypothetical protein